MDLWALLVGAAACGATAAKALDWLWPKIRKAVKAEDSVNQVPEMEKTLDSHTDTLKDIQRSLQAIELSQQTSTARMVALETGQRTITEAVIRVEGQVQVVATRVGDHMESDERRFSALGSQASTLREDLETFRHYLATNEHIRELESRQQRRGSGPQ